jgi:hypothetical protein
VVKDTVKDKDKKLEPPRDMEGQEKTKEKGAARSIEIFGEVTSSDVLKVNTSALRRQVQTFPGQRRHQIRLSSRGPGQAGGRKGELCQGGAAVEKSAQEKGGGPGLSPRALPRPKTAQLELIQLADRLRLSHCSIRLQFPQVVRNRTWKVAGGFRPFRCLFR